MDGDATFFALRSEALGEAAEIPLLLREHPTAEQTAEYVDGRLGGEELQVVTDHLSSCEQCAFAVDDLRSFRNQVGDELDDEYHPTPFSAPTEGWRHRVVASLPSFFQRSPALAFGAALTLLLLAMSGWLVWQTLQENKTKPETVVTNPPPTVP